MTGDHYRETATAPPYDLVLAVRRRRLRYLGHALRMPADSSPAWKVDLDLNDVNGHPVTFKLDSGADVSVMSDSNYKQLRPRPSLKTVKANLNIDGAMRTHGTSVRLYAAPNGSLFSDCQGVALP